MYWGVYICMPSITVIVSCEQGDMIGECLLESAHTRHHWSSDPVYMGCLWALTRKWTWSKQEIDIYRFVYTKTPTCKYFDSDFWGKSLTRRVSWLHNSTFFAFNAWCWGNMSYDRIFLDVRTGHSPLLSCSIILLGWLTLRPLHACHELSPWCSPESSMQRLSGLCMSHVSCQMSGMFSDSKSDLRLTCSC